MIGNPNNHRREAVRKAQAEAAAKREPVACPSDKAPRAIGGP